MKDAFHYLKTGKVLNPEEESKGFVLNNELQRLIYPGIIKIISVWVFFQETSSALSHTKGR